MRELFTLGKLYVSDFIPQEDKLIDRTIPVELKLMLEEETGAVRLEKSAPLSSMYGKYWYRSGINQTMRDELKNVVDSILKVTKTKENDIWLDIACNDGSLFEYVPTHLIKIGVDPADDSFKKESEKKADVIIQDYFNYESYQKSRFGKQKAKIITVIAMFYDLENPNIFLQDVYKVLDDDGILVMQMSYTPLMLEQMAFDNIVHEHIYYYSLFNIKKLLEKNGLSVVDCTLNDINGGSFRVFAKKTGHETKFHTQPYRDVCDFRINSMLEYEKTLKLDEVETWVNFYKKINELKDKTVNFIREEKAKGKKIIGYGACHDTETRVVTESGIKYYNEIQLTDKVYTLNIKTGEVELSPINEILIYPYNGKMIHFKGKRIDMLISPNHNILYESWGKNNFKFLTADKMALRSNFTLPKGKWSGKDDIKFKISDYVDQSQYSNKCIKVQDEFNIADFLYLLGIYIGDGYVSHQDGDFSVKLCIPKKDKARKKVCDTLINMNIKYREYDTEIQFSSQALRNIFMKCGESAFTKKIPKWALEYSPKNLRYILNGLIDSDGWYEKNDREKYSTSSFTLVKDIIELCIKLGYFPSYQIRKQRVNPKIKEREIKGDISYIINISKSQTVCYIRNTNNVTIEDCDGIIWCLSVNNKNFLVERNGKIAFSGNSTKGNTTLQYFGLDNTLIDGIAERSIYKWGLKTVGTNIPIFSEEEMRQAKPDYLLILPWHFINEFIEREKDYLAEGGKFIVPCPKFEIIGY